MNWLDLFDDGLPTAHREMSDGPCDDDCEETAPFIGMLPDESDHEDGSPLDFGDAPGGNVGFRFVKRG
jgi:hypothetical protein